MNKLITKALTSNHISPVFKFPKQLLNKLEADYLAWLKTYLTTYGVNPTIERFKDEFPFFEVVTSGDPIEDIYADELKRKKRVYFASEIEHFKKDFTDGADPSPLVERIGKVFAGGDSKIMSVGDFDRSIYFETRKSYSYGVDFIDESTGGLSGGDLAYVVGRPGSNKTTFCEWMAVGWSYIGLKVLYITNENAADEVLPKLDAFYGGWNPIKLRTGGWTSKDRIKIKMATHITSTMDGAIFVPSSPAMTTAEVAGLTNELNPDIILIDGVYLMNETPSKPVTGWEDATAISRNLKRLARKTVKPIVGVIQANRRAEGSKIDRDTIAHTDAFLSDADAIIGLSKTDDRVIGQVIKSRWGATMLDKSFEMVVDFRTMRIDFNQETIKTVTEEEW